MGPGEVRLGNDDIQAACDFYAALGFRLTEYTAKDGADELWGVWLQRKGNPHDIVFSNGRGPRLHHFAYTVPEVRDLYLLGEGDQLIENDLTCTTEFAEYVPDFDAAIGVTKWEPPQTPEEARGQGSISTFPSFQPRTDLERCQNLKREISASITDDDRFEVGQYTTKLECKIGNRVYKAARQKIVEAGNSAPNSRFKRGAKRPHARNRTS